MDNFPTASRRERWSRGEVREIWSMKSTFTVAGAEDKTTMNQAV